MNRPDKEKIIKMVLSLQELHIFNSGESFSEEIVREGNWQWSCPTGDHSLDDSTLIVAYLYLSLAARENCHPVMGSAAFYSDGTAEISGPNREGRDNDGIDEAVIATRDIFDFRGDWEEIFEKLYRLDNLIMGENKPDEFPGLYPPTDALKERAKEEKPYTSLMLVEWGKVLGRLRIVATQFASSEPIAHEVGFTYDDGSDEDVMFELFLHGTVQGYACELDYDYPLNSVFYEGNYAIVKGKFLGREIHFPGTWEEVARKLFKLEKELLAQVPEVPTDLKP